MEIFFSLAPCKRFSNNPFPNGYIKQNRFRHDETVIFGCKNPYVIDGLSTLRCIDGKWDKNEPFCGGKIVVCNLLNFYLGHQNSCITLIQ